MAATLSAGVGSLILKLDTPYDRVRTTDARDDLEKVQVWCSTTSGFTPSNSNKVFDGLSLSVVISKITTDGTTFTSLIAGTTYYVKYAFISAIDDVSATAYTVSSELNAIPIVASAQTVDISGYTAFVKNSAGTTLTPSSVTLTAVLNGITSPVYAWTITGGTLSSTTASSTTVTPTLSSTSVTVTLSVTGTGISTPIVKTIVMAVVNDGQNATAYGLVVSAGAIQKTKAGVLNPSSITVYGYFAVGTTTPGLYAGRFKIYENGSAVAIYTSAANQSSYVYTPSSASITSIKVELYLADGTTKVDEQSIPVVIDGTDTVTAVLSNEAATVPADNSGTVTSFAGAATTMSVYVGATDDSANWTFSAALTNITATATNSNRTQTVTALSAVSGYIDITASKAGYPSIIKRFNVNKALNGPTGSTGSGGISAVISKSSHVFPADTTGAITSYLNSGTELRVYEGATELSYDGVGTSNGTWTFSTGTPSNITVGSITDSGTYATIGQHSGVSAGTDTSLITYTITGKSSTGVSFTVTQTQTFTKSKTGPTGGSPNKYAVATIYKWASVQTPNPTGSSTYTWSSGTNSGYTGTATDGWYDTVPTNPGTSSLKLWTATKTVTDVATAFTTPVDWTTGVMIGSVGGNGALGMTGTSGVNGVNAVTVNLYKAGLNQAGVGSPTGTSTYLWSNGTWAYTGDATWTKDPPLPSASNYGLTLWAARVTLIESAATAQSIINWTTAALVPISYYGANGPTGPTSTTPGPAGASARVAYAVTTTSPAGTPANKEETGDVVPATGTWFPGVTWLTNAPATPLTAGQFLYQVDGLYNPVTGKTNWIGIPYLSNLKVGNLAALAVNTGALTVSDTITVTGNGTDGVLIKTDGIYIYNAGVLRVKLGSI